MVLRGDGGVRRESLAGLVCGPGDAALWGLRSSAVLFSEAPEGALGRARASVQQNGGADATGARALRLPLLLHARNHSLARGQRNHHLLSATIMGPSRPRHVGRRLRLLPPRSILRVDSPTELLPLQAAAASTTTSVTNLGRLLQLARNSLPLTSRIAFALATVCVPCFVAISIRSANLCVPCSLFGSRARVRSAACVCGALGALARGGDFY